MKRTDRLIRWYTEHLSAHLVAVVVIVASAFLVDDRTAAVFDGFCAGVIACNALHLYWIRKDNA